MNNKKKEENEQKEAVDIATPAELAAFKQGKNEIARGDYVTLTELRHSMDSHRQRRGWTNDPSEYNRDIHGR